MKDKFYYQFLPGSSNEGEICLLTNMFVEDGEIYYEFDNGEICFSELIADFTTNQNDLKDKVMVRLASRYDKWTFDDATNNIDKSALIDVKKEDGGDFQIPTYNDRYSSNGSIIKYTAPKIIGTINVKKPDLKDFLSYNDQVLLGIIDENLAPKYEPTIDEITNVNISVVDKSDNSIIIKKEIDDTIITANNININNQKDCLNDPVAILVNKSAKFTSDINMTLSIDLPAKSLFKIAKDNFDNGDETFIDVILADIDYDTIKKSLREALLSEYSN